ncbi:hypothetical protein PAAG_07797 [Paracoccidioides lutzii Pb01]|uniref:3-hydroxyacyl-CoA dehydrogenase C-terminal domain-containing protein n=1 Tax=Paracoccidioides lutzii (strain ATCC MYA-826 / Pb01) TaxID=502779 RepID=C1HA68_PARBA|nr:hypothetical protein PAAG_07797 [Paracoccidioides lutzii Pb01]EEH37241.2 hypothetical protein PAAG_07797 [Paracoccidioides lutzii Pb01]
MDTTGTIGTRTNAPWQFHEGTDVILELAPGSDTPADLQETTGFVANRLAYALLREAVHLMREGVVGVEELNSIVENSMGRRWTVAGPFKSYHMGSVRFGKGEGWEEGIFGGTEGAYGPSAALSVRERDEKTKAALKARGEGLVQKKLG